MTDLEIIDPIAYELSRKPSKDRYDILIILGCGEPWEIDGVPANSPADAIQRVIKGFLFFVHMTYDYSVHPSRFQSITAGGGLATFIPSELSPDGFENSYNQNLGYYEMI